MNFDEGVRYLFCEGVGRVSITFSIVISVIKLSKGLGCVIISVHDHNGRPYIYREGLTRWFLTIILDIIC